MRPQTAPANVNSAMYFVSSRRSTAHLRVQPRSRQPATSRGQMTIDTSQGDCTINRLHDQKRKITTTDLRNRNRIQLQFNWTLHRQKSIELQSSRWGPQQGLSDYFTPVNTILFNHADNLQSVKFQPPNVLKRSESTKPFHIAYFDKLKNKPRDPPVKKLTIKPYRFLCVEGTSAKRLPHTQRRNNECQEYQMDKIFEQVVCRQSVHKTRKWFARRDKSDDANPGDLFNNPLIRSTISKTLDTARYN